ncbi:Ger(x)C family spore germination protein [Paenibacillus sp. MBLB2552]|uniref:Ger(X)C family spore germination protein n=1 Tax=Paenibacillus mellifer TaxID=2937794 RepID=A0A9X2BQJ2_9BACL|nr:Ger(x)C family spore germination protein [Paenibacillus mellifer]MCK8488373.1 Ger(x)C family spore germination protein [Paenibacillus mellifer]
MLLSPQRMKPIFAFMICICLCGCWSRKELTDLAIVSATGVDRKDNQWELTYQLVTPAASASGTSGGNASSGPPISVLSIQGDTLRKAFANNELENTRQLHIGNNRVFVIGDAAAKYGLNSLIDTYLRNPQARETVSLFVTKNNPRIVVSQLMYLEKNTGEGIHKLIEKETQNTSILPKVNMFDLATESAGASKCAVIPELRISGKGEPGSTKALENTTTASKLKLGGLAILNKGKLVGWLNQKEALGIAFIRNRVNRAVISFEFSGGKEGDKAKSTFEVSDTTTRLKMKRKEGRIIVTANIKAKGMITDTGSQLDAIDPKVVRELEQGVGDELLRIVLEGWHAIHGLRTDVVGFADLFHRKYPRDWQEIKEDWAVAFAGIEFQPSVEVTVERVGLINQSYQKLLEE